MMDGLTCFGVPALIVILGLSVFLGVALFDLWIVRKHSTQTRVLTSILLLLLPEVGVIYWALSMARSHKAPLRILALLAGGTISLASIVAYWVAARESGPQEAWSILLSVRWYLLPGVLFGALISFVILHTILRYRRRLEQNPW